MASTHRERDRTRRPDAGTVDRTRSSGRPETRSVPRLRRFIRSLWYAEPTPRRVWVQNVDADVAVLQARLAAKRASRAVLTQRLQGRLPRARRRALERRLRTESALDRRACLLLLRAQRAAHRRDPIPNRLVNWWGGRLIEAAYQNLHAAEALVALFYDWDEIEAEVPEVVARVEAGLQRDDPRRIAADGLRTMHPGTVSLTEARSSLYKAIEVGHAAADRDHSRLRSFRNAVLIAATVLTLLMGVFVWYSAEHHAMVPLCFTPTAAQGETAIVACPTHQESLLAVAERQDPPTIIPAAAPDATGAPTGSADLPDPDTTPPPTDEQDILLVALLGVMGAALSAAIAIKGLTGTSTPYEVPLALATLKLPMGALTAVGGLLALHGEFVPGLSELDSQGQILAYALVFGYAQQLLSGLLDKRGQTLLEAAPGKSKDVQHAQSVPVSGTQLPTLLARRKRVARRLATRGS